MRAQRVRQPAGVGDHAAGLAIRTGAEQRVDHELPGVERRGQGGQFARVTHVLHPHARVLERGEHGAGRGGEPRGRHAHRHRHPRAACGQHARRHQAVAAVVASARQHEHAQGHGRTKAAFEGIGHGLPRALHERRDRCAGGDRGVVDGAHLGGRQQVHQWRRPRERASPFRSRTRRFLYSASRPMRVNRSGSLDRNGRSNNSGSASCSV